MSSKRSDSAPSFQLLIGRAIYLYLTSMSINCLFVQQYLSELDRNLLQLGLRGSIKAELVNHILIGTISSSYKLPTFD